MYYCDAYGMGGYYCAEFDLMQANMYGWQLEAHPDGERAGVAIENSSSLGDEFGVGGTTIDTTDVFRVSVTFTEDADTGEISDYIATFTQGENQLGITGTNRKLKNITTSMSEGMVLAFSSYGTQTAEWLQGTPDECALDPEAEYPYVYCETSPSTVISNINIVTVH